MDMYAREDDREKRNDSKRGCIHGLVIKFGLQFKSVY